MASASLYLPLVNWHHYTHPTTTTTLLYSHPYVYAGQQDGHIWVYTIDKETGLQHKYLLTGHKAAITALCIIKSTDTEDSLLSADETGTMEYKGWTLSSSEP
ncbi:hypothetical protein BC941DRAFT_149047 [Chlamydoabsidia padenii]|nr:hypothetical protein BC941DRAFT_149047 [Chlamydoabsidia padenii]